MHWLNRILIAVFLVTLVAYGPEQFETSSTSRDLERVRKERETLRAANEGLREELRQLRAEVEGLRDDPVEIARIAREDLNLVAPGEVVFEVEREASR